MKMYYAIWFSLSYCYAINPMLESPYQWNVQESICLQWIYGSLLYAAGGKFCFSTPQVSVCCLGRSFLLFFPSTLFIVQFIFVSSLFQMKPLLLPPGGNGVILSVKFFFLCVFFFSSVCYESHTSFLSNSL